MAAGSGQPADGEPPTQKPRKPHRTPAQRYNMQARSRRRKQEDANYCHPPKPEEMWMCQFCEYEAIFGVPPYALVRQYEIKDRKEQKRLEEKKRLLEKAKTKGRRGKKGNKNAGKGSNAAAQQSQGAAQGYSDPNDQIPIQSSGTQSDEYFGDEYDNDPTPPIPAPPETPTRIPQPITQQPGQSTRVAYGTGANRPG